MGFRLLASALVVPFLLASETSDSGPTASLLFPHTQPPPPPRGPNCPTSLQWHLPQNSFHVRAGERKRLDPCRKGEGKGAGCQVICVKHRGRYKIPLGPGGLKPQLSGSGHPGSPHSLFLFSAEHTMGLSDGEWQLVLNVWGKVEADIPGHGQEVLIR